MNLFRPDALARLQSPDRLDRLMLSRRPRRWLVLAAVALLLVAALVWGCLGSVATTVHGQAILIHRGGTYNLCAQGNGIVTEVLAATGQLVNKDQLIAGIDQPVLRIEIRTTEAHIENLKDEYEQQEHLYEDGDLLYAETVKKQRSNLDFSIEALDRRLADARQALRANHEALAEQRKQIGFAVTALERNLAAMDEHLKKTPRAAQPQRRSAGGTGYRQPGPRRNQGQAAFGPERPGQARGHLAPDRYGLRKGTRRDSAIETDLQQSTGSADQGRGRVLDEAERGVVRQAAGDQERGKQLEYSSVAY